MILFRADGNPNIGSRHVCRCLSLADAFRRKGIDSLFVIKDLAEGETITAEHVRSIRPGYGVLPKHLKEILGKKAPRTLRRGEPITESLLEAIKHEDSGFVQ